MPEGRSAKMLARGEPLLEAFESGLEELPAAEGQDESDGLEENDEVQSDGQVLDVAEVVL